MLKNKVLGVVLSVVFAVTATANERYVKQTQEAVPGEFLVKMRAKRGFSVQASQKLIQDILVRTFGSRSISKINALVMDQRIQKVKLADSRGIKAAVSALKADPRIQYVEPNYILRAYDLPNDADFSRQWDMYNTGQADSSGAVGSAGADINVAPVWKRGFTGSKDLIVAVIDTGIDYNHRDLKDNMWVNAGEIPGNNIDDDNNGVVDDVYGANFVEADAPTGNPMDDNNHGTHCAGTIGAKGNDSYGITGVNWNTSLMAVKFLSGEGSGTLEGGINSIKYAQKMGAKVMSNSWGASGFSQALYDAVAETVDADVLFVAAAGNSNADTDSTPHMPSSFNIANVVSVAASTNVNTRASFSNYGKRSVHVAAPGNYIYSTVAGGGYDSYRGTSMACPHVSGIAALVWAYNKDMTAVQLKERLIKTSTPLSSWKKLVVAKGVVNTEQAFDNVVPPNDEPKEEQWVSMDYALESDHPYANDTDKAYEVLVPGAKFVRVVFEKFETEARYDYVHVETADGERVDSLTGLLDGYVTEYVKGEKLILRFKSDWSEVRYGFKVAKVQYIP